TGTGSQGAAAISPDKQWIITGSSDKSVRVWRVGEVDTAPLTLNDHSASITCVAATQPAGASHPIFFSGDGSGRGNLWSWDDSTSSWKISGQLAHYSGFAITAARFTPDGRTLITAGADHRVRQWSASDGKEHLDGVLQHPDAVRLMRLSPSGELLVTMTSLPEETQLLQVWNLQSRKVIHEHRLQQVSVQGLAISPDSTTLAYCDSSPRNTVWRMDLATGKVEPFWANGRLQASVWGLAFTPDGTALATVGGNRARLWSVAAGERLQSFSPHGPLSTADFSPSGKLAITAGSDGVAKVWNVADQQVVAKLAGGHNTADGHALPIMKAMFLSETRVLTLGEEGHACLWQLADGEPQLVKTFVGKAPWTTIAAASSGQRMLAGTKSGALEWWNLAADEQPIAWQADDGHTLSVSAASISADGRFAITGAQDNIAIIWDTTTGKITQRLKGHTAGITAVGFSPDVRRALTASDDGTAKLWDIASGVEILAFDAHQSEVTATSFSPQGNQVLTASRDRTALLWTITAIAPALGLRDERLSVRQSDIAQPVDSEPIFTDADVITFAGAKLTITIHGAPLAGLTDELQLRIVAGDKLTRQGDELFFQSNANAEPVAVGRVHYDPSAAKLEVTFLAAANHQAVEQTLASVNYRAQWRELPPDNARSIALSYTDAAGLTSPPLSKPVAFEANADELVTVSH
ncbi:MAG TPA: WD40 repeat domain-containing protein, partial [Pirellulaceae bacterium]|nr:WD40 repeat domain-containing protein [Pirellulaceae bacterium]